LARESEAPGVPLRTPILNIGKTGGSGLPFFAAFLEPQ
jgi:hypothetical protein